MSSRNDRFPLTKVGARAESGASINASTSEHFGLRTGYLQGKTKLLWEIRIVAVAHVKRRSGQWLNRIGR
jgi:hypothetical protein